MISFSVEPNKSIEAKSGPTHGVHPRAKVDPIRNDPKYPAGFDFISTFFSFCKKPNFMTPVMLRPKMTIMMPPILL